MHTALMIHPDRTVEVLQAPGFTIDMIDQHLNGAGVGHRGPGWILWYDPNNTLEYVDPDEVPENPVAREMLEAVGHTRQEPIRGRVILATAPLTRPR